MDDHIKQQDLSPAEVNEIIHRHRKVRYGTACYPCRQRKVKCDNQQPCNNCVKRDHASLCSYNPKQQAQDAANPQPATSPAARKRAHSSSEHSSDRSDAGPRPASKNDFARYQQRLSDDEEPAGPRYVGERSTLAFLSEQSRSGGTATTNTQDVLRKDIMPILGMHYAVAPYPFMSNESIDQIRLDIVSALPPDKDVLHTFQVFRHVVQPIWGLLMDPDEFESTLCTYLEERTFRPKNGKGVSMAWVGTLFAALAMATQYCDMPQKERTARSQYFIKISFQCLRLANFLLRPSLECIQALLIIQNTIANDVKAEAAWSVLGMTCRLAQSLGLHRNENRSGPMTPAQSYFRRKLWWTLVWQDSFLCLSFDRPPVTTFTHCSIPVHPSSVDGYSYTEAVYHISQCILKAVGKDTDAPPDFHQIMQECQEVENVRLRASPRMQSKDNCRTIMDRLQYYALSLHISFVVSVLCRPALTRSEDISSAGAGNMSQKQLVAQMCKKNLADVLRNFLNMNALSPIPTRSWSFTHHGLSSAVLLGILGETKADPEVREMQGALITVLDTQSGAENETTLLGPLARALTALRNVYEHGWITESQPASAPSEDSQAMVSRPQNQAQIDEQNAALAMTSLQNGNDGMVPNMGYAPPPQPPLAPELQYIDQSLDMSPMDLFDSIFWDPSLAANVNAESAGFDYLPQQQYYPF